MVKRDGVAGSKARGAVKRMNAGTIRLALLAVAVGGCLAAGCGIGGGSGSTPSTPTITTNFSDDFSQGFSTANWQTLNSSLAPVVDSLSGNPAPSLELPTASDPVAIPPYIGGAIQSRNNFSTGGGATASVDVGFPQALQSGQTEIATVSYAGDRFNATFMIIPTMVNYTLGAGSGGGTGSGVGSVANDSAFHHYAVTVAPNGDVALTRDGTTLVGALGTGGSSFAIILRDQSHNAAGTPVTPTARFDNVLVTHP